MRSGAPPVADIAQIPLGGLCGPPAGLNGGGLCVTQAEAQAKQALDAAEVKSKLAREQQLAATEIVEKETTRRCALLLAILSILQPCYSHPWGRRVRRCALTQGVRVSARGGRREAEQAADSLRESLRQSLMEHNARVHEAQTEAHSAQLQVGVQQRKMQEHIQQMQLLKCASNLRARRTHPRVGCEQCFAFSTIHAEGLLDADGSSGGALRPHPPCPVPYPSVRRSQGAAAII
jgi:hypothetical protein